RPGAFPGRIRSIFRILLPFFIPKLCFIQIMRRNRTYPHNWVVVKEDDNKQDNLVFGFWNPVDLMSCSNEEFSLPNIDVASNSEMKNTDMIIARNESSQEKEILTQLNVHPILMVERIKLLDARIF